MKSPSPCQTPGCPRTSHSKYCDECRAKYPKRTPDFRPSAHQRKYTSAWRKLARVLKAEQPLCVMCQAEGIIRLCEESDHIKEIKDGGAELDSQNTQNLCKSHHRRKTLEEKRKRLAQHGNSCG